MMMRFLGRLRRALDQFDEMSRLLGQLGHASGSVREALGRIEGRQVAGQSMPHLADYEFKVYSQWGEDGIIQRLIQAVPVAQRIFVEFGVQDYTESNTRYLLTHDNWSGLILDGSDANIAAVKREPLYWRYNLKAVAAFVTRENINQLLRENGLSGPIGLLSVDIDGVDYWIWEAIDAVTPALVIAEYNARFGPERAVTVPYDPAFVREQAHHSAIYYGASLAALVALGRRKGYAFLGANSAGNNAFFVRRELLPAGLPEITAAQGYVPCRFREARNARGKLAFLSPEEEAAILELLPLVEVKP